MCASKRERKTVRQREEDGGARRKKGAVVSYRKRETERDRDREIEREGIARNHKNESNI